MSVFKRLSATMSSRIDHMVSQIENHDAVIEAALKDARTAAAKAKVRLSRVGMDGARLRKKHAELLFAEKKWAERARSIAADDEDKALECLRRRRECQQQLGHVQLTLAKHAELEERLGRDIRAAEERVTEIAQQRNLMRTRQSAADALNTIASMDHSVSGDIADTFERWEIQVSEAEMCAGAEMDFGDTLERGFVDQEDREALRAELQELMSEEERD